MTSSRLPGSGAQAVAAGQAASSTSATSINVTFVWDASYKNLKPGDIKRAQKLINGANKILDKNGVTDVRFTVAATRHDSTLKPAGGSRYMPGDRSLTAAAGSRADGVITVFMTKTPIGPSTIDARGMWVANTNSFILAPGPESRSFVHEFGHVLLGGGHHSNQENIMYYSTDGGARFDPYFDFNLRRFADPSYGF